MVIPVIASVLSPVLLAKKHAVIAVNTTNVKGNAERIASHAWNLVSGDVNTSDAYSGVEAIVCVVYAINHVTSELAVDIFVLGSVVNHALPFAVFAIKRMSQRFFLATKMSWMQGKRLSHVI